MLDSLRHLLSEEGTNIYIGIDYEPILTYYIGRGNQANVEHYTKLMLREQDIFKQKSLNFNLVESIVELQTEHQAQETKIEQLKLTNHRLWLLIGLTIVLIVSSAIVIRLLVQRRRLVIQVKRADERLTSLVQEPNQSKDEKEEVTNEIKELLQHHENRKELETLTPHILKDGGETKFRQCFELLHPLFLHRLRERVPSITRREELLSMLIVLKQDNRDIAELLAIAPRSVLMLRHRFRQKIGMATEVSLEQFIDEALNN
jgi:DNA-binding CsgD family transcriptional regulator